MSRYNNNAKHRIDFEETQFKQAYIDEYTGEILQNDLIKAAMIEELTYLSEKEVWMIEDISKMKEIADNVFVRCRWVLSNKGDDSDPDMRTRLVSCEANKGQKVDACYAATPPLESKKALFSIYATEQRRNDGNGKVQPLRRHFIDIKKAYFNAKPRRAVFMRLPPEMELPSHCVARQTRCVYGTRDAGMLWEECYRAALEDADVVTGRANPCLLEHVERDIQVVVHGDDFTALGTDDQLDWYTEQRKNAFEIQVRGRLGLGCEMTEIKILNWIIRIDGEGLKYEADPRHVELLAASMGLVSCSPVKTPGIKPVDISNEAPKGEEGASSGAVMDNSGAVYSVTEILKKSTTMQSRAPAQENSTLEEIERH